MAHISRLLNSLAGYAQIGVIIWNGFPRLARVQKKTLLLKEKAEPEYLRGTIESRYTGSCELMCDPSFSLSNPSWSRTHNGAVFRNHLSDV